MREMDEVTHTIFEAGEDILRCLIANNSRDDPARRHYEGSEEEWKVLRERLEPIWGRVTEGLVYEMAGALLRFNIEFASRGEGGNSS